MGIATVSGGDGSSETGSASVELVLVTPLLMLLLLLTVYAGRVTHHRLLIEHAASQAARAATLAPDATAAARAAAETAHATLVAADVACGELAVDTDLSGYRPGGHVTVSLRCRLDHGDLAGLGLPGHQTISATAVSPVDAWRDAPTEIGP